MKPHNEICEVYSVQFVHTGKPVTTFTPTSVLFVSTTRQSSVNCVFGGGEVLNIFHKLSNTPKIMML